jgi:hypothetical protein
MSRTEATDVTDPLRTGNNPEDRLPTDWKLQRDRYSVPLAMKYKRILRKLELLDCMSKEECERAAFVFVSRTEKEEAGLSLDDD